MVPRVRRIRVQLHDTYQSEHRHRRHDHGEEQRTEHTDVRKFHDEREHSCGRKRLFREKSNRFRRRIILVYFDYCRMKIDASERCVRGLFKKKRDKKKFLFPTRRIID